MLLIKVIKTHLSCFSIITLIATLIASCDKIKKGSFTKDIPVVINLDSSASCYSLASLVDSVKAIDLQTVDGAIISDAINVKRIIYNDGKFFVLDQKFFSIKVFDSTGKYLYDVGRLGLGKGEFLHLEDIEFNFPHNLLMVLANRPLKILVFAFDGHLVKEEDLDFFASEFAFPSADRRIFYVNQNKSDLSDNKNILVTDSNNVIKNRMFDFPQNIFAVVNLAGGLYSTDQGIYFNPAFSNTFYTITGDTAKPVFKTNYGSKNIPEGLRQDELFKNLRNFGYQCATFAKYKDYIGFNYQRNTRHAAFFNTRSGKIVTSDVPSDSLNILFSNSIFENDGKLMMILDINRLSGFIQRNSKLIQQRFPDLYTHINIQKAQQNPILLTFTLKAI